MEMKKDAADLRVKSNGAGAKLNGAIEMELYDDLIAFSALSPEKQLEDVEQATAKNILDEQAGEFSYPEISSIADEAFEPEEESPLEINQTGDLKLSDELIAADQETLDFFDELIFDTIQTEPDNDKHSLPDNAAIESQQISRPLSNTSPLDDAWSGAKVKTGPLVMCHSCGNKSDVEDLFCIACGEFLARVEVGAKIATTCVECDALIGNDDLFCSSCGLMISA